MLERGVSFVPGSAPAGRADVNCPVANTRLPTITWSQTTPLICTVGNAAADTVSGTDGSGGTVSAAAGVMPMFSAMKAKFALISTTASDAAAHLPIEGNRLTRRPVPTPTVVALGIPSA